MIKAKPIEWAEISPKPCEQWYDSRYGFSIVYYPYEDDPNSRYQASWGEGDTSDFANLEEAKQWCQDEVDSWVRENVVFEPSKLNHEEVLKVEKTDHPDLVGGIVWADCELNWIRAYGIRCYETGVVKGAEDMRERAKRECNKEKHQFELGDGFENHAVGAEYCEQAISALPITPTNTEGEYKYEQNRAGHKNN